MLRALERPPIPRAVSLWKPATVNPFGLGQWVEIKPQVKVEAPVEIGLGSLPLSVGLFAGSGLVVLIRPALPKGWPQGAALVVGSGLAVAGIINLILPKAEAAGAYAPSKPGAPAPSGPPPSAPGRAAAEEAPAFTPSAITAFANVIGRIVSPGDFQTVDIGPFAKSYPVRVQLHNPSSSPVTFTLELSAEESPNIGAETVSVLPVQVSLGPGQVRDIDVAMPISSWDALVDYVDVVLTAKKRRVPEEAPELLHSRSFVIE